MTTPQTRITVLVVSLVLPAAAVLTVDDTPQRDLGDAIEIVANDERERELAAQLDGLELQVPEVVTEGDGVAGATEPHGDPDDDADGGGGDDGDDPGDGTSDPEDDEGSSSDTDGAQGDGPGSDDDTEEPEQEEEPETEDAIRSGTEDGTEDATEDATGPEREDDGGEED